jgi:SagB-type dehydrogenase family enzyme
VVYDSSVKSEDVIELPPPATSRGGLERAIAGRRSRREFRPEPLHDRQLSLLLWATQGVTDRDGSRSAPSAGALYPLEIYVATASGLFHYEPARHRLHRRSDRDLRKALYRNALAQEAVRDAPAVFVIAAVHERIASKYGAEHAPRYVHMEVGHAAQNLLLQATALGLGGVPIGAFHDDAVHQALRLPADHAPLYLVPVGSPVIESTK